MKKEEILKVVRSNEGTVLSFPDRGPWGNNRYRGNCSGYIHAFLIDQYNVDFMAEMYILSFYQVVSWLFPTYGYLIKGIGFLPLYLAFRLLPDYNHLTHHHNRLSP